MRREQAETAILFIHKLGKFPRFLTAMPAGASPGKQQENLSFNTTSFLKSPIFYAVMLILK